MNQPTPAPGSDRKPRVAVVFGGRSSEHAISCVTARGVLEVIDRDSYDVVPIGIASDGRWVLQSDDLDHLRIDDARALPSIDADGPTVVLAHSASGAELLVDEAGQTLRSLGALDVVFPLLHGPWGEDGTIQGLLEMAQVRYVGAGVLASAISMDKVFMKLALRAAGLPVLDSVQVTAQEWASDPHGCRQRIAAVGYPVFVKPARGGSSIGIGKAAAADHLDACVVEALRHDPKVLVEVAAVGAREIEVGVLENRTGAPETTRPGEIRVTGAHEFYDFAAKYLPEEATELDVPAHLPADIEARVREMAARAFEAVGCEGLARVDFFVQPDGTVVVNEINTMPGFTPLSMFPRMWAASGVDYPALVDRLLRLALTRGTGLR